MTLAHRGLLINDGQRVFLELGDKLIDILPGNIVAKKSIAKVEREVNQYNMSEFISVTFNNGHRARLLLHTDRPEPVMPDALKEFHATCIMVYDL